MGRNPIEIDKNELKEKLIDLPTQQDVADYFGCSQGTISNKVAEYELGPKLTRKTKRRETVELPNYTYDDLKKKLIDLEDAAEKTIGYNEVEIDVETDRPIGILPLQDFHIGARYVNYKRLFDAVDTVCSDPYKFTTLNGDFADNYTTSAYKAGQIEQAIPIQEQKASVESIIKRLAPSTLSILNGCHDEWSYLNDGFDFAQYLANKSLGYYMGHNGLIHLKVGEVTYDIYVSHNTYRNSTINPGHGLAAVAKEGVDFDIGVAAHVHKAHYEQRIIRGELKTLIIGGAFKGEDRHASKSGFPPLMGVTPGFILNPHEKKIIGHIDYKEVFKYL